MIDPLRFDKETISTYEIERPAFCTNCLSQRQSRNNPNVAVIFCQECPNLLGEKKEYGALLCSSCNADKHKPFNARNHVRQIIVVGPGLRKKLLIRGDGVNYPLPLDQVTVKMKARIYHNGRVVHRERSRAMGFTVGQSGKCLHIQILGARNLGIADISYTSDPYVIFSFCGKPLGTTRVRPRTLNPRWNNETFVLPLDEALPPPRDLVHSQRDLIKLEVFDHDYFTANDFLGHVEMTRSKLAKLAVVAQEQPIRIPLTAKEYHGILSVQFGHTSKELTLKVYSAEDLDKSKDKIFNNPYCKIYLGEGNLVGITPVVKKSINPVWNERNEFRLSLHDFFQIEALLEAQLRFYRASSGLAETTGGGSAPPASRGGRRGGAAMFQQKPSGVTSRVMFEEFNDLPEYLAVLRIEIYSKNWMTSDHLLGKTMIHVEQLRLMIPELAELRQKFDDDAASFLLKNHRSLLTSLDGKHTAGLRARLSRLVRQLPLPQLPTLAQLLTMMGLRQRKAKEEEGDDDVEAAKMIPSSQRPQLDSAVDMRDVMQRVSPPLREEEEDDEEVEEEEDNDVDEEDQQRREGEEVVEGEEVPQSSVRSRHSSHSSAKMMKPPSRQTSVKSILSRHSRQPSQGSGRSSRRGSVAGSKRSGRGDVDEEEEEEDRPDEEVQEEVRERDEEEVSGSGSGSRQSSSRSSGSSNATSSSASRSEMSRGSGGGSGSGPGMLTKMKSMISRSSRTVSSVESVVQLTDVFRLTILNTSAKMKLNVALNESRQEDLGCLIVRLVLSNRGKVITGLDEAVQRMTLGETSLIRCRYDYAYGSYAVDRNFPPRSNVIFKLKLVEINGQGKFSGVFLRMWKRITRQVFVWRRTWYRYWYTDYYSADNRQERSRKEERRSKKKSSRRRRQRQTSLNWLSWLLTCDCVLGRRRGGYPGRRGRHPDHDDVSNSVSEYSDSQGSSSEYDDSLNERDDEDGEDRYLQDEEAYLQESEHLIAAEKNAAQLARKAVKVDKRMKKHLTPAVKAGAKLMWNTPKTKLFEHNLAPLGPAPAISANAKKAIKRMRGDGGKAEMRLMSASEDNKAEDAEENEEVERGLLTSEAFNNNNNDDDDNDDVDGDDRSDISED